MAAVLCKSIGELCALPFKCCAAGCQGFNKVCGGACKGCTKGCDEFFRLLCRNPFSLFVAVALFTQGPAIFLIVPAVGGIPDCPESLYLVANTVLAAVNVFTAFYLAYKITDTSNQQMGDTTFKRATYLLCNDPWIAIYICLFIGFMCVQAWGATLGFGFNSYDNDIPADDQLCPEQASSMLSIGISLGWTFCFLGFGALMFSLCCAKFDNTDYTQPPPNQNTNNTNPSVPHGSHDTHQNTGGNAAYNAEAYPENDFVNEKQGKNSKPSASSAPPMYNQNGVPSNDFVAPNQPPPRTQVPQEEEVPIAYAEAIPQASAPPSSYDSSSGGAAAAAAAPAAGTHNNNNNASTGGKVGGTAGKQIGKMFSKDEAKQQKIAEQGQKAGETLETGLLAAKNFFQSKLKKNDKK